MKYAAHNSSQPNQWWVHFVDGNTHYDEDQQIARFLQEATSTFAAGYQHTDTNFRTIILLPDTEDDYKVLEGEPKSFNPYEILRYKFHTYENLRSSLIKSGFGVCSTAIGFLSAVVQVGEVRLEAQIKQLSDLSFYLDLHY